MSGRKGQIAVAALAGLALALAALFVLFRRAERKLDTLVGGLGEGFSTKIYSAPLVLHERIRPSPERLMARLDARGYVKVPGLPKAPGQYAWFPPFLTLYIRAMKTPALKQEAGLYNLIWKEGEPWTLKTSAGDAVPQVAVEPELVAELSGAKRVRREPARFEDLPESLKNAVIATEDKRFYRHWGVDPRGVARTLWQTLRRRQRLGGASTLTQQLAKNFFLTPKRTLGRKLEEALLAFFLELRYGKKEILTLYLNHIYLGQDGPIGVAGMRSAAKFYFDKDLKDLSLADCAMLAGLIRSPYRYNPRRSPELALDRRSHVLRRMLEEGMIAPADFVQASSAPLTLAAHTPGEALFKENGYYVAEVVRRLMPKHGEDELFRYGLSIYTDMDPELQKAAQRALEPLKTQGALVALDPYTGAVLALAGGTSYSESQFNRATQARRQPGSAFKPFVYGAALESGFTPISLLHDQPRNYPGAEGEWNPKNYNGVYRGTTTVREALADSLNAATLDLAQQVGVGKIAAFARRMGIEATLDPSLALALGASDLNLLELTAAYAPFDNGGKRIAPSLIEGVYDAQGRLLEASGLERSPVLEPARAYVLTSLLQSVVADGTAKGLAKQGWSRPSAGKTGTTNKGRDAWFIGYTPQLLAGVWVGEDQKRTRALVGAKNALPPWTAFMGQALQDYPVETFAEPSGVVRAEIDPASGSLATPLCPRRRVEVFVAGSEPKETCPLHPLPPGPKGWLRRLFHR